MSEYVLHLSEDESVVISGAASRRLLQGGDGDGALLYIAILRNKGSMDDERLRQQLGWEEKRFRAACASLERQGLIAHPGGKKASPPELAAGTRTEYTRMDMVRAMEGAEFAALVGEVESLLGKKLTTPDLGILLGLYDDLGLPADVIYLLVSFCAERSAIQYGPGRKPTLRQIEREGYTWARLGLMTQEDAAGYIRKYHRGREHLPRMMKLLRLGDRMPSPSEEKYLLSWIDMGFEDAVIELAYDRTVVNCKELKWPYINKILTSWHQQGLHTMQQVRTESRPGSSRGQRTAEGENTAIRTDMARMEKYRRQMRKEKEGK